MGLSSSSSVHNHLRSLQEMGFISRDMVGSRNIELLGAGSEAWKMKEMVAVPLVGRITAGQPILAVENVEDTYPIPKDLVGCSDDVFTELRYQRRYRGGPHRRREHHREALLSGPPQRAAAARERQVSPHFGHR